jgi:hypothetical protein
LLCYCYQCSLQLICILFSKILFKTLKISGPNFSPSTVALDRPLTAVELTRAELSSQKPQKTKVERKGLMNVFRKELFLFLLLTVRVSLEFGFSAAASDRPTLNPPKGWLCYFPGGKSRLAIMPATKSKVEAVILNLNCFKINFKIVFNA